MRSNFVSSLFAGACISLGGFAYIMCDSKPLGAFLFCIGLYSVLIFELNLYTGKVCFLKNYKHPFRLFVTFLGNTVGAVLFGVFLSFNEDIIPNAQTVVATKLNKDTADVIISAIVCGICIAVAVKGYREAEENGKFLIVILGVMTFILAGGEHIIADIFYVSLACAKSPEGIRSDVWQFLLTVLVFNTVGGLLFSFIDKVCNKVDV